jgi:hypothetical protein
MKKAIRAQSAISDNPPRYLFLSRTVFSGRMVFIRPENTVGARSAQWPRFAGVGIQARPRG